MNPYRESDLQAYVAANFSEMPSWGMGFQWPARLLGEQVQCATGIIDLLGAYGHMPLIVELKAEMVTEKVVGQIMRYKAAVEDAFVEMCFGIAHGHDWIAEIDIDLNPTCLAIIAPSFDNKSLDSLYGLTWLMTARQLEDGSFAIEPFADSTTRYGYKQPQLTSMLKPLARSYVGWRLGCLMAQRHRVESKTPYPFEV